MKWVRFSLIAIPAIGVLFGIWFSTAKVYYKDYDGDGYGDAGFTKRSLAKIEGYVLNGADCFDENKDAYPGQPKHFIKHRGDGSFDYDCNGVSEKETTTQGKCNGGYADPQGWEDKPPECGKIGRWLNDCDRKPFGTEKEFQDRKMACR